MSTRTTDVWVYSGTGWGDALDITGYKVEALDGSIGKVDRATYQTKGSYIVVDTGPWIFGKKVLLPAGDEVIAERDAEQDRLVDVSQFLDLVVIDILVVRQVAAGDAEAPMIARHQVRAQLLPGDRDEGIGVI